MVRVHALTTDKITAWRIRDLLATHPLLGSAAAQIDVQSDHETVILTGWAADAHLLQLVEQLATNAAGRRTLSMQIHCGCITKSMRTNVCAPGGSANTSLT